MVSKLTREQLRQEAEHMPLDSLLGKGVSSQLTPKQKAFARKVASGKTKAQAYREAYKRDATPATLAAAPYRLAADARVSAEIAALEVAERAAAYRTPSRLRALVVETLAQVATNPDEKTSDRLRAAQLIGQITEVAAFTERKEVRTINTSEAARAKVLEEIKAIMAGDDSVTDVQAKSLLDELQGQGAHDDLGNIAKPADDTGAEYASSQVIDSIGDAGQDGEHSADNPDFIPSKPGETLGGV
jgi:hypothetical protein